MVGDGLALEQRQHDVEHLVGPPAALRLVDADGLVLGLVPADAGAEDHPVVGQELERRQLLGQEHRVAQRHDQDRGAEPDPLGHAGGHGEREHRLEPVHRVEPLADEQVIGDEQRVEAEVLDRPRERLDAAGALRSVALPDVGGQEHPEPADVTHVHVPPAYWWRLTGRGTRVALGEERTRRPRACPRSRRPVPRRRARRRGPRRGRDRGASR